MSLKEVAAHYREVARQFSEKPLPPHEERIRRCLQSLWGREPTREEIEREVACSRSLRLGESR